MWCRCFTLQVQWTVLYNADMRDVAAPFSAWWPKSHNNGKVDIPWVWIMGGFTLSNEMFIRAAQWARASYSSLQGGEVRDRGWDNLPQLFMCRDFEHDLFGEYRDYLLLNGYHRGSSTASTVWDCEYRACLSKTLAGGCGVRWKKRQIRGRRWINLARHKGGRYRAVLSNAAAHYRTVTTTLHQRGNVAGCMVPYSLLHAKDLLSAYSTSNFKIVDL